ncbi:MAG: EamA family transporter [Ilumatobacteraceae bacterium]
MAVLLALVSAFAYGVSDYVGGRTSRKFPPLTVAVAAEVAMVPMMLVVIPLVEDGPFTAAALVWGIVGGLAGTAGILGLYAALSRGAMTVVAPITGVVSAVLPVSIGVATGDRPGPSALLGIVLAVVAVAMIGGLVGALHQPVTARTVGLAVVVGVLFGTLFVAFAQPGDDAGLWPLLAARIGSTPMLLGAYLVARRSPSFAGLSSSTMLAGVVIGGSIVVASGAYVLALGFGLLSVVSVIVALYPASTVGLAALLDAERSSTAQRAGMALAVVAVALITLG